MPYLRFKGFEEEFLKRELAAIVELFSHVAAVPRDIVKVESVDITRITDTPRSLEIYMFPRSQEKHDAIAAVLNELLCDSGYPDVHIFFVLISPSLYYKNGEPLQEVSWLA